MVKLLFMNGLENVCVCICVCNGFSCVSCVCIYTQQIFFVLCFFQNMVKRPLQLLLQLLLLLLCLSLRYLSIAYVFMSLSSVDLNNNNNITSYATVIYFFSLSHLYFSLHFKLCICLYVRSCVWIIYSWKRSNDR